MDEDTTTVTSITFSVNSTFDEIVSSPYGIVVLGLICTLSPFIICANALVIISYKMDTRIRNVPYNLYITNLAIADLMVGIVSLPLTIFLLFVDESQIFLFQICGWFIRYPLFLSVFLIMLMTFDRLKMVSDPVKHKMESTSGTNLKYVIFVWIFSALYALSNYIPYWLGALLWPELSEDSDESDIRFEVFVTVFGEFIFNFVIPLSALVYMNIAFIVKLRHLLNSLQKQTSYSHTNVSAKVQKSYHEDVERFSNNNDRNKTSVFICKETAQGQYPQQQEGPTPRCQTDITKQTQQIRKVAKALLLLVIVYVICWVPPHLHSLLRIVYLFRLPELIYLIGLFILFVNSVINPVIYAATSKRYRTGMIAVLRRKQFENSVIATSKAAKNHSRANLTL
ncbi:histamine H4 receptor-like [Apostichopus japonicus]|uniref:histamine H4 receptor-like n=1 Tax=Stichopus japonicus TaxID=307972 RepID=UPI003AB8AC6E